jgi:hypothetical protein
VQEANPVFELSYAALHIFLIGFILEKYENILKLEIPIHVRETQDFCTQP